MYSPNTSNSIPRPLHFSCSTKILVFSIPQKLHQLSFVTTFTCRITYKSDFAGPFWIAALYHNFLTVLRDVAWLLKKLF